MKKEKEKEKEKEKKKRRKKKKKKIESNRTMRVPEGQFYFLPQRQVRK